MELYEPADDLAPIMNALINIDGRLEEVAVHVVSSRTTMKKKRKKTYLSPEFYARGEETRRILTERLEFHRRLREQRAAQRGEQASAGE